MDIVVDQRVTFYDIHNLLFNFFFQKHDVAMVNNRPT